jgi:ParB/RepB/Spo0J family partition protein
VTANPENPRKEFGALAMKELAESIAQQGLLQPIAVRRLSVDELGELPAVAAASEPERYEIILGERRWRAHVALALPTIEAKVYDGVTRAQAKAAALIENLQRERMNPIEEAEGFRDLMLSQTPPLTKEQVAEAVGKSRPVVSNALRVLELPAKAVELIREGKLTLAHGVALARFKAWPDAVSVIAEEAAASNLSAAALEKDVPCENALRKAGLIVVVNRYLIGELPAEVKKHPAYLKGQYDNYYCFEPSHWQGIIDAQKAEKEAEAERLRKKQEAAAKTPKKIKSLEDLPRAAYRELDADSTSADRKLTLALVPEESVHEVAGYDGEGKVQICTRPQLVDRIETEVRTLKGEDRMAKIPALFDEARAKIAKLKKVTARELMLLVYLGTGDRYPDPYIGAASCARLGVKLPKGLVDDGARDAELRSDPVAWVKFLAAGDVLDLVRVLFDDALHRAFFDGENDGAAEKPFDVQPEAANHSIESDAYNLLRWILERDDLGLLEETKAGQKQILETIKAADWYQQACAAIEDGDAAPKAKGKGKAAA